MKGALDIVRGARSQIHLHRARHGRRRALARAGPGPPASLTASSVATICFRNAVGAVKFSSSSRHETGRFAGGTTGSVYLEPVDTCWSLNSRAARGACPRSVSRRLASACAPPSRSPRGRRRRIRRPGYRMRSVFSACRGSPHHRKRPMGRSRGPRSGLPTATGWRPSPRSRRFHPQRGSHRYSKL